MTRGVPRVGSTGRSSRHGGGGCSEEEALWKEMRKIWFKYSVRSGVAFVFFREKGVGFGGLLVFPSLKCYLLLTLPSSKLIR